MLDSSAIILIGVNIFQMVSILVLLFPLFELELIATCINNFKASFQTSNQFRFWCVFYCVFIALFGIIAPIRTLNSYGSTARDNESSREKLIRIIQTTNAARNYILGGFSLFFLLVGLRLFDFLIFSAKLHEFSILMSNYHLIDITCSEIEEKESNNLYTDDIHDDSSEIIGKDRYDIGHWPSFINLRKLERVKIRKFLQSLECDTWSISRGSRKGSVANTPSTLNTIELPTNEKGIQARRSSRSVTLPTKKQQNYKELDEDQNTYSCSEERLKKFREHCNTGVERVKAWKDRAYDDKEHFYVESRKKHVKGDKENDYTNDSEPSTSAGLASNSAETLLKSEDIDGNDQKTKKGRIAKKDIFRFR